MSGFDKPRTAEGGDDLDAALRVIAARVDVTPAAVITASVDARLHDRTSGRAARSDVARQRSFVRALATRPAMAAVAVVVVVALMPVALSQTARATIGRWLGVPGVRITEAPAPDIASPSSSAPTTSIAPAATPDLGSPSTLVDAGRTLGFDMVVPQRADMARPDAVYVAYPPDVGEAILVYRPSPGRPATALPDVGLLLAEFRGQLEGGFFQKVLPPGARLEEVTVNGRVGYWIEGPLHEFFYRDAAGNVDLASVRLAANTLLWTHGELTLRIESGLSKEQALAIAVTVG